MQQSFEMSEACQHPTRGGIPDPRAAWHGGPNHM